MANTKKHKLISKKFKIYKLHDLTKYRSLGHNKPIHNLERLLYKLEDVLKVFIKNDDGFCKYVIVSRRGGDRTIGILMDLFSENVKFEDVTNKQRKEDFPIQVLEAIKTFKRKSELFKELRLSRVKLKAITEALELNDPKPEPLGSNPSKSEPLKF